MGPDSECRYRVLLLEDNPLDATLAEERLRGTGLGFDFTVADSRARFEEEFYNRPYDLILADYSLPDFDGLTALQIVRGKYGRLPFIFVSGMLGEDVAVETLQRGATDYVLKQKLERLNPAVTRALSEHADFLSRERAESHLRKVEERFEKLTNSLPAMVWTCNDECRLGYTNDLWERRIGDARCWFEKGLVHDSDFAAIEHVWEEAKRTGKPFEIDCRYRMKPEGKYRWQLVRGVGMVAEDGRREWVGTCTDIEEQKARDAELKTAERLALTGRMASVIAHEINNPLEALTNILFLVRSNLTSATEADAYLSDAEHELQRISTITKQTLQWSREEGGVHEVNAAALMNEAMKLFTAKVKNKSVEVELEFDEGVQVNVVPGEIRQVLANLISNAIDAIPAGGKIKLTAVRYEDGKTKLVVEDNGPGIEPDRVAELFRPFQSTKGSLGNGLGLYVSKGIIDRHGGEFKVESVVGVGTKMILLLPV